MVKPIALRRCGNLTVEQARKEAQKVLGTIAKGNGPQPTSGKKRLQSVTLL